MVLNKQRGRVEAERRAVKYEGLRERKNQDTESIKQRNERIKKKVCDVQKLLKNPIQKICQEGTRRKRKERLHEKQISN